MEKIKVQLVLVLQYKKVNDCNGFHSSVKLIASDSDIDEAFESLHQSIMIKIKKSVSEDRVVTEIITRHGIKIFEC